MTLPHIFVPSAWERRRTGHMGVTYLIWTFVDLTHEQLDDLIHAGFKRHEQRHVQQSVAITVLWFAIAAGLTRLGLSPWWLLTSLVAWPIVYGAVSIVWKTRTGKGYTDNFFERDARRYAARVR